MKQETIFCLFGNLLLTFLFSLFSFASTRIPVLWDSVPGILWKWKEKIHFEIQNTHNECFYLRCPAKLLQIHTDIDSDIFFFSFLIKDCLLYFSFFDQFFSCLYNFPHFLQLFTILYPPVFACRTPNIGDNNFFDFKSDWIFNIVFSFHHFELER